MLFKFFLLLIGISISLCDVTCNFYLGSTTCIGKPNQIDLITTNEYFCISLNKSGTIFATCIEDGICADRIYIFYFL